MKQFISGIIILVIIVCFFNFYNGSTSSEGDPNEVKGTAPDKIIFPENTNKDGKIDNSELEGKKISPEIRVSKEYKSLRDHHGFAWDINKFEGLNIDLANTIYSERVNKTLDSLKKLNSIQEAKDNVYFESLDRKNYQETLRNSFLDSGLDIKVKVFGKDNTKISLTYTLFNDVFLRKLETSGNLDKLHKKGFNTIIVDDDYNYKKIITYN